MPHANQYLLLYVLDLLSVFSRKSERNLMTSQSEHSRLFAVSYGGYLRRASFYRPRSDLQAGADVPPFTRALAFRAPTEPGSPRVPHRVPRLFHARDPTPTRATSSTVALAHAALNGERERERRRGARRLAPHRSPRSPRNGTREERCRHEHDGADSGQRRERSDAHVLWRGHVVGLAGHPA